MTSDDMKRLRRLATNCKGKLIAVEPEELLDLLDTIDELDADVMGLLNEVFDLETDIKKLELLF